MQVSAIARELYSEFAYPAGVSIDSRQIRLGTLFFGLPGEKVNGSDYAHTALAQGARRAIVNREAKLGTGKDSRIIVVDDVLQLLTELAYLHRTTLHIPVLAVTGTNGKTTTKELLRAVLTTRYRVHATDGNFNNDIGVPLTLLATPPDTEFLIVEMGANHPGEILQLCEIAAPTHGLITSIGAAHLEGFGSIEGVAKTKSELFAYLKAHEGLAFVRSDDVLIAQEAEAIHLGCAASTYSLAAYKVQSHLTAQGTLNFSLEWQKQAMEVRTQLVGEYNTINAVAALHVGHYFNIPLSDGAKALAEYSPHMHRSQLLETGRNRLIIDCYNANPTSMQLAIESFMQIPSQEHRLLILGEMKELGTETATAHTQIQSQIQGIATSRLEVWYVGKTWELLPGAIFFPTVDDCARHILLTHYSGALILLKGSHSVALESLIPLL